MSDPASPDTPPNADKAKEDVKAQPTAPRPDDAPPAEARIAKRAEDEAADLGDFA